ncbi:hypothetical protein FH582_01490 (plasmid) [Leptospira interrogans]|uniref:hypothetical protein n=1 Tax=Leptospira interrogans TaxID=173 RepID=UPI001F10AAFA|nr:hypothetical protein [Leptospira interrogans]UMQ52661.1 hypothetical protein FH582_01490 [Leptospira interrogans]
MLEITGNDISILRDDELRDLIGLLCEAEVRSLGYSEAIVTWGGHQDAPDGGVDVRVAFENNFNFESYIPRGKTIFQVKKTDMTESKIRKEMLHNDFLKPTIRELEAISGSYIIVSISASLSDSLLSKRRIKMEEIVEQSIPKHNLKLDYYDQGRVAAWVRSHPSLILWVRQKINKPLRGWFPFANWTNSQNGKEDEYLIDNQIRIKSDAISNLEGFFVVDGINELRSKLQIPGSIIRLIGLSGVGKTRLVQALFDQRIGIGPLNQFIAYYADTGNDPDPSPLDLLHQLISLDKKFIIVIDNCSSLLHRKLSSMITSRQNQGCLITVEYDIRDDQPDETDVYKLEPASSDLIEQLLKSRFEYIHEINVRKIVEFSGGNARIAIALANTIVKGKKITILRDEDLFERLFYQRHSQSHSLLRSAEICSLIYSFDIRTREGNELEINLLSKLASKSLEDLFSDISELRRRDLIQQRGFWRAVLPHAIANRLAIRALENIPMDNILNIFENGGSVRLLLSFSRRLGFLHESPYSNNIANKWFSFGGMLHNLSELGSIKRSILRNVAPIVPGIVLDTIEKTASTTPDAFFSISNEDRKEITRLLRLIAYEQIYFERCIKLLIKFALMEKADYTSDSTRKLLGSLFYLKYSGTHALADQRLKIIDSLLQSTIPAECDLGFLLMDSALDANAYGSIMNFEFGALQRDYGYYPASVEEIRDWYSFFLKYLMKLYSGNLQYSNQIRSLIAKKFRDLWNRGYANEELEALIGIFSLNYWREGWVSVRNVIIFDSAEMENNLLSRLLVIENLLKPKIFLDRLRTYLFSGNMWNLINEEGEDAISGSLSFEKEFLNLTRELTFDKSILEIILGEVSEHGPSLSVKLGQGLAVNANDPLEIWQLLLRKYREPNESEMRVINGFLFELYKLDLGLVNQIYDDLLQDEKYSLIFPCFQLATPLDYRALKRLEYCIDNQLPKIEAFKGLILNMKMQSALILTLVIY